MQGCETAACPKTRKVQQTKQFDKKTRKMKLYFFPLPYSPSLYPTLRSVLM
jgi:hypothetical protein